MAITRTTQQKHTIYVSHNNLYLQLNQAWSGTKIVVIVMATIWYAPFNKNPYVRWIKVYIFIQIYTIWLIFLEFIDIIYVKFHKDSPKTMNVMGERDMMKSSNGNIFRVTGPLRGESTGHRWIPLTKALMLSLICAWTNGWASETPVIWGAIALIMASM